jgi:hypothetical protein
MSDPNLNGPALLRSLGLRWFVDPEARPGAPLSEAPGPRMAPGRAIPTPIMIPDLPGMASPVQAPVQVPIGGSAANPRPQCVRLRESGITEGYPAAVRFPAPAGFSKKNGNLNLSPGGTGPGNPISRVTSINCTGSGRAPGESAELLY